MSKDIIEKLDRILEIAGKIKTGALNHISVQHDAGCPALRTGRLIDCTCKPDIEPMRGN